MIYATIFCQSFYRDGVRTCVELVPVHSIDRSATAASIFRVWYFYVENKFILGPIFSCFKLNWKICLKASKFAEGAIEFFLAFFQSLVIICYTFFQVAIFSYDYHQRAVDKELNLARCRTRNRFVLVGEIQSQGGQLLFISIARNVAYPVGLSYEHWEIWSSLMTSLYLRLVLVSFSRHHVCAFSPNLNN